MIMMLVYLNDDDNTQTRVLLELVFFFSFLLGSKDPMYSNFYWCRQAI